MKKLMSILFFLILGVATVHAQEPAPLPDTVGDKVKQGDPEVKNPPPTVNYLSDAVKITSAEIPFSRNSMARGVNIGLFLAISRRRSSRFTTHSSINTKRKF